jgi:hypothetical protein
MGSQVAEELISQITLNDAQFQQRAKPLIATANAIATALNNMKAAAGAANQALGVQFGAGNTFNLGKGAMGGGYGNNYFGGGGNGGGGGTGGVGGGGAFASQILGATLLYRGIRMVEGAVESAAKAFLDFSGDAMKEFETFDTVEKAFIGIYGSSQKAAQMMGYLKDQAMTSAFQMRDLADAARGLAVAGLDVGRFLPIVQGFALAMGKINGEGLEDFVSILRRLQGGNTGMALGVRGIGRYGVSRAEMEQYGAKFGGPAGTHFEGTVNQAFDIIEKIFKARIEKIAQSVTASSEVVASNWKDAIQLATIDAGAGIMQNLIEPIKQATAAMNSLRQAGFFKDLFDTLYQIIGVSDMLGSSEKLRFDFSKFTDPKTGQQRPATKEEMKAAIQAYERTRFGEGDHNPLVTGSGLPTTTGDKLQDIMIDIGGYIVTLVDFAKLSWLELVDIYDFFTGGQASPATWSLLAAAMQQGDDFRLSSYMKARNDWRDRVNHPDKYGAPTAPSGNAIPGLDDEEEAQTGYLSDIAANTRSIKQRMEAFAYGGNDATRHGVTPVELSAHANGRGSKLGRILNVDALSDFINDEINAALGHERRRMAYGGM